jgi:GT2 family glycosyltransferase
VRFGIVLVDYNGWPDTFECLRSLSECCQNAEVVLVNNASKEDYSELARGQYPGLHVIKSQQNMGWSGGNNLGIKFLLEISPRIDAILLLNNDTVVHPNILELLGKGFSLGFDVVGPVINDYKSRDEIQTQGVAFNIATRPNEFFTVIPVPVDNDEFRVTPVDIANGCAVAITREVFEKTGLIDERFFLICEESDFCLRAQEAGFKLGIINRSLVWHKHSVSFNRAGKPLQRYYGTRNLWLLLKKHPNGKGRRGRFSSVLAYFRHQYHLFCHEVELGNPMGASAIVDGISDALLGKYGARNETRSWISRSAEKTLYCVWFIQGGKKQIGKF